MQRAFKCITATSLWALSAIACASRPAAVAPTANQERAPEPSLDEPYLPARTEFTIVLDEPMAASAGANGRTFQATLRHPVRSPDNEIVIHTGAHVRGTIVSVEHAPIPRIKLRFVDIDTAWGRAPLGATLRSAEPFASVTAALDDGRAGYDVALLPSSSSLVQTDGAHAVGGGPRWDDDPAGLSPSGLTLPKGAELRLVLVKPLIPPPHVRSLH